MAKTSINNVQVKRMNFNGNQVNKAYLNGVLVFAGAVEIFYTRSAMLENYGRNQYARYKVGMEWVDTTYPHGSIDEVTCVLHTVDSSGTSVTYDFTLSGSEAYNTYEYGFNTFVGISDGGSPSRLDFTFRGQTTSIDFSVWKATEWTVQDQWYPIGNGQTLVLEA